LAESWLVSAGVTCFLDSREPISTLDIMKYVTPSMVRNFWLWEASLYYQLKLITYFYLKE